MEQSLPLAVSADDVHELLQHKSDGVLLLDCRRQDEYDFVHIEGATLVPMDELAQRCSEIDQHRDKRIVVYCHAGVRSQMVAQWLRAEGFGSAQTMAGGIDDWSVRIDPSLPRY